MEKLVRRFVCAKCFNPGGTLANIGDSRRPMYVHAFNKCGEVNYEMRNRVYQQNFPRLFWLPLLNLGLDYNHEEVINGRI